MSARLEDRLHRYRRFAGLTQRELAQRSGVSISLIRQLEQGERSTTRLATAHRLARALGITTSTLIAEHVDTPSPTQGVPPEQWATLHRAISDTSVDQDAEVPTIDGVRTGLSVAMGTYQEGNYESLTSTLPMLIHDARALAELRVPEAPGLLTSVLTVAARQMIQTRHYDIATAALDQAEAVAPDRDHKVVAVTTRCWLHIRRGRLADSRSLAERWADEIEPRVFRATPQELAGWGWMLVRGAAAAGRDGRPDEADHMMRGAAAAAAMLPAPVQVGPASHTTFGPDLVDTQRAEHAMLRDRPDLALKIASTVDPTGASGITRGVRRRHLITRADAQTRLRRYTDATHILMGLDTEAPQWLAYQRSARDVVEVITSRRRSLTPELRHLGTRLGLV